jgi:hypothetical protein
LETGQVAAVALGFVETLAALELEIDHFLIAVLIKHGGGDGGPFHVRIAHAVFAVGAVEEDLIQGDGAANFSIEFLDVEFDALGNAVLFTAGFDDCESHMPEPDEVVSLPAAEKPGGGAGRLPQQPAGRKWFL